MEPIYSPKRGTILWCMGFGTGVGAFGTKPNFILKKDVSNSTIHTYIIGHYNPSVKIIDLVSYTTYVMC